jgi:hypothetical protein
VVVDGDFATFVIDVDVFCFANMGHFGLADPVQDRIFGGYHFVEIRKVMRASLCEA